MPSILSLFFRSFVILCAAATISPAQVSAAPEIPPAGYVQVCSAIVYDLDDEAILFEQNADERIPPASLTKVMSMHLALDHVRNGHATLASPVTVSQSAAATTGSRMGLVANESLTLDKLLQGMAVSSGNDASHAVAEFVGGSAPAFVRMMNVKARELGMSNSNFATPHGLPAPNQYTTARDMLSLARSYLKNHPSALNYHNMRTLTHRGRETVNKNPLLGQFPGADGLKTGWIRASGYNLIFTAKRDGKRLLAVILGAPDVYTRGNEACRLLEAGFMASSNRAVSVAAALETMQTSPYKLAIRQPRKKMMRAYTDKYMQRRRQKYQASRGRATASSRTASMTRNARKAPAKVAKKQPQGPRRHAETRNRARSRAS